ncbi:trafficking protein particle complex subunit 4-like [Daphnia carinata]|uniref:trafficking protein particle complex subunit 4-like n=1 Tax=Daphnia carinata TaxID=120202 RepID=UPI00257B1759|nr:trafficking protein particle complex subunit 4-like [Daphnia carinata]
MAIYSIFILSKSGGLIYQYDHTSIKIEVEKTFTYPLDIQLVEQNKRIVVAFGQKDGINVGHHLLAINGIQLNGMLLDDGREVTPFLADQSNFPLSLKFGRPKLSTNEKIFLASMFYPLFAIASQLSPELKSSGIEVLEADTFKLHCFQTLTGIKFLIVAEPKQLNVEHLLRRVYELYADFALKNPFYSLEMPIRCEQFESNLQLLLEQEKGGVNNV